jgi:hypothetical protein
VRVIAGDEPSPIGARRPWIVSADRNVSGDGSDEGLSGSPAWMSGVVPVPPQIVPQEMWVSGARGSELPTSWVRSNPIVQPKVQERWLFPGLSIGCGFRTISLDAQGYAAICRESGTPGEKCPKLAQGGWNPMGVINFSDR